MIRSVLSEEEWIGGLRGLPVWHPIDVPIVLIAPHPDDETLGAGGFLAAQRLRGIDVTVIAVTDGENAYSDCTGLAEIRRQEQDEALRRLGVPAEKIIRFGLPDSGVTSHKHELVERLVPLVSEETHLLAPWKGDFHPDHTACGYAAEEVACLTGAPIDLIFLLDLASRNYPSVERSSIEIISTNYCSHGSESRGAIVPPITTHAFIG